MNFFQKIKEMAGFGKLELKNPDGLSEAQLSSMLDYFSLLDQVGKKDLKARFIRYIVDDQESNWASGLDAQVLQALGLSGAYFLPDGKTPNPFALRRAALHALWREPVAPLRRFGVVLDKFDSRQISGRTTSVLFSDWFDALIRSIVILRGLPSAEEKMPFSANLFHTLLEAESDRVKLVNTFLDDRDWMTLGTGYVAYYGSGQSCCNYFSDLDEFFAGYPEVIRSFLQTGNSEQRVSALRILRTCDFETSNYIDELIDIAVGSSKTAREEALAVAQTTPRAVIPKIVEVLTRGSASRRYEAVSVLAKIDPETAPSILREHMAIEKSDKVKQAIEIVQAADSMRCEPVEVDLPLVDVALGMVPLKNRDELATKLLKMVKEINLFNQTTHDNSLKHWEKNGRKWREPKGPYLIEEKSVDKILDFVEGKSTDLNSGRLSYSQEFVNGRRKEALFTEDLEPVHAVRLLYVLHQLNPVDHQKHPFVVISNPALLDDYRKKLRKPFGLRELDAIVATLPGCGPEPGRALQGYLYRNSYWNSFCDWEPDAIWPAFIEQPQLLMEALTESRDSGYYFTDRRPAAYKALSTLPQLPPQFATILWEVALGESKTDRPLAQEALQAVPDKVPTILKGLRDGRQVVRAVAADWLGRLDDQAAIKPLKESVKKEKSEVAKAAMLQALESLGAEIEEFLDREKLLKEAEKGLTKKLPKGMEWVPLENLPTVRWADSGEPVPADILKWWVVQGIQLKSAECSPLLKRYLGMCEKADAVAFAQYILSAWISHDTAAVNPEEAAARAERDADQNWNSSSSYMKDYYRKNYASKEVLYKALLKQYSSELLGTATAQKGMLAIVSAAGDDECAKKCEKYIRKWYGQRLSQCKALVTVLASIESTLALQILLSLANRFRTKGIKDLARKYVDAIADSQGWTLDELADRTVPDGGFARPLDENEEPIEGSEAVLELDFGPRQFLVKLDDRLVPVLTNKEDGKVLKNLPAPGKNDDEEKAREAKKEFSDAKKIVKEMVKRQTERLYEAMCTQRTWTFRDWKLYLAEHPIVGRLCTRLIWAAREKPDEDGAEGKVLCTFRLLEDGSLTDSSDEAVQLKDDDLIILVHSCKLDADTEAAWKKHIEDYDVEPLFNQLDRPVYKLADGKEPQFDVVDFVGHMLTVFKLRTKATRLGYTRGAAEDGGCFYRYHKPFQSLGIQAVIEFSGSMLPEEDGPCALKELSFTALSESGYSWLPAKIGLESVPAVLLTECYNDLKQIAAEGSGYNENWEEVSLI
ncbi:DUF4132 domain-containing protein [bacterium]|nr:DUF4132 domain-containing protein [bacterium]